MNGLFQQIQNAFHNPNGVWGQSPPIQPQWPGMAPPPPKEEQKQGGGGLDLMKIIGSLFGG